MEQVDIHDKIKTRLSNFIENKKVPNIIFYGETGSGKKTLLREFLRNLYGIENDCFKEDTFEQHIKIVNCAYGKGIRFIREELKFFAKTRINDENGSIFKSVVLLNAEQLTIDAQSALRRCIELFTNDTRFFIVVNNKQRLIKPIISRFCCIYVSRPVIDNEIINLYDLKHVETPEKITQSKLNYLKKVFKPLRNIDDLSKPYNYFKVAREIVERGITGLHIIQFINNELEQSEIKYKMLMFIERIRVDMKNEILLIQMILNLFAMRNNCVLENVNIL